VAGHEFSLFLAGDAMVVTPWSDNTDRRALLLFDEMRDANVTILNLETVIRGTKGRAQADCGGIWMTSPPLIASEFAWAGVNMVSHANNHAFDYGSDGILETIEHIEAAGMMISGSGSDLQRAREPKYFEANNTTIGHVSMATTYIPYGKASRSRPNIAGRPGINPLTVDKVVQMAVPAQWFQQMEQIDRSKGRDTRSYQNGWFMRNGMIFRPGKSFNLKTLRRPNKLDFEGNLASVTKASENADIVVVSIHSHDQSNWLRRFAHQAIEAGADIVLVHGPHMMRGVELYNQRAIFYCLGDFAYQSAKVDILPSDAYDPYALGDDATPKDWVKSRGPISNIRTNPKTYQSCATKLNFSDGRLKSATFLPLDLSFSDDNPYAGHPGLADRKLGEELIREIAQLSHPFGVKIIYDEKDNVGRLTIQE
jgi:poly-gamma-glutamate capsule biosynthesis protein CapA/YwtB (metallophosphatase superfamily)